MYLTTKILSVVALSAVMGVGSLASAECRADAAAAATKPTTFHYEQIAGKRVMVIDPKIVICGHPARPAVVVVTTAKAIEYSWLSLEETLLPRILDSVKQAPLGGTR